jgi:membrane-associated HD superfamily phosphohydrolase
MRNTLIIISSILTLASVGPYLWDIIKGKTKPRVVSWLTWSLLTGISCAASFADHAYAGGILLLFATIETLLIAILGFKHGDRKFERFDIVCQVSAVVGLALWLVFNSPTIAIAASVAIDIIGALPTIKHIWQKPHEETWLTFLLASIAAVLTLMATTSWRATTVVYPLYIVLVNALFAAVILIRHKYVVAGEFKELREL